MWCQFGITFARVSAVSARLLRTSYISIYNKNILLQLTSHDRNSEFCVHELLQQDVVLNGSEATINKRPIYKQVDRQLCCTLFNVAWKDGSD